MRLSVLALLLPLMVLVAGCTPKPPQGGKMPPEGPQVPGGDEVADADEGSMGIFSDPGGIPACDLDEATGEGIVFVAYADLDDEEGRECIILRQHPGKGSDGLPAKPASAAVAKWSGDKWEVWDRVDPPAGEQLVDEQSIAFAEDMNEDGIIELGLMFDTEGERFRMENLYIWQVMPAGLRETWDPMLAKYLYPGWQTTEYAAIDLVDVDDEHPGKEIIVVSPTIEADEDPADPHPCTVVVWYWQRDKFRSQDLIWGAEKYDNAQEALDDWLAGKFEVSDEDGHPSDDAVDDAREVDLGPVPDDMPGPDAPIGGGSKDVTSLLDQADSMVDDGDWDGALAVYDKAVKANPRSARAYLGRGRVRRGLAEPSSPSGNMNQKLMDSAIGDLSQAIKLNSTLAEGWYERGYAYSRFGLAYFMEDGALGAKADKYLQNALKDYQKAHSLDPRDVQPLLKRGEVYEALGEYSKGIAEYRKALKVIPNNTTAKQGIERCKQEM